jgi:hypothetical protein
MKFDLSHGAYILINFGGEFYGSRCTRFIEAGHSRGGAIKHSCAIQLIYIDEV